MAISTDKQKTDKFKKEVELLRSFVIGFAGKVEEGEYRPEFARKMLAALDDRITVSDDKKAREGTYK